MGALTVRQEPHGGEPADGTYRLLWSGELGETVKLPEPCGVAVGTAGFPRP
ncbi:hypothetical protein AB0O42_02580 [Streptomyces sp. NPDC089922]|uniref:hypothetical protein n=1 Tax=Streptomyces sp. NPDC089922 TaxID=3155189 RepID=UPI00341C33A7